MSTATISTRVWRDLVPAGKAHGPLLISTTIHDEIDRWWAESPRLSVAKDTRDGLSSALKPAVGYLIEQTPDLQGRPAAWQTRHDHSRAVQRAAKREPRDRPCDVV